jgi:hypothetical protein
MINAIPVFRSEHSATTFKKEMWCLSKDTNTCEAMFHTKLEKEAYDDESIMKNKIEIKQYDFNTVTNCIGINKIQHSTVIF